MPKGQELESPTGSEELPIDDAAKAAEGDQVDTDANPAESSAADTTDANEQAPQSLLDVVKSAVEKPAEVAAESSTTEDDQEKTEDEDKPEGEAEAKVEDDQLPFHNHPRWKEVLRERDAFKPDAESYRNITAFMDQHGLTGEEMAEGFDVMAQLKSGDPEQLRKALSWFEERTDFLRESIGAVLPSDLQAKVDDGLIDEEAAQETARLRAERSLQSRRDEQHTQREEASRKAGEARTAQAAVATAVQGWEEGLKKSDPDYAKKAELVETTAQAFLLKAKAEGKAPRSPEEAVALCDLAYAKVNETFKNLVPKRKPVDTTTPAGSSARTTTEPKTLREAINAAVGQ